MKKLLFLLLIFICGKTISAQTTVITNEKGEKITQVKTQIVDRRGYTSHVFLYHGSIYYNDGYEMATIKINGGQQVDAPVMFNLYADELIAKVEGNEILFKSTDFSMRGQNFITIKGQYYELLFENNEIKVLKRYNCTMRDYISNEIRGYTSLNDYEGEFVRNELYFFQFPNNEMQRFDLKRKNIVSILEKENPALSVLFRNRSLVITNIEQVIKLLN